MKRQKTFDTRKLVLLALLTALVIILQLLSSVTKFGVLTLSFVLVPIVVGAALTGVYAGGWLGLVFGFMVLMAPDTALFLAIDPFATVAVVLLKGAFAGLAAGAVYKLLAGKSKTVAAISAAVICPIVNTGIFVLGSYAFFMPTITEWGTAAGFASGTAFLFLGMIGVNFLIEFGINLVLSPVIVRLIQYGQDKRIRS